MKTVNHRKQTVTVGRESARERIMTATYPTPAAKPSNSECQILFHRVVGATAEKSDAAADIALEISKALCVTRVLVHIRIQRLTYNENGNLSEQMGVAGTRNILVMLHHELLLEAAKK